MDAVYHLWFKPRTSDLEFGRFAATFPSLPTEKHPNPGVYRGLPDLVETHKQLCARIESCDICREELAPCEEVDYYERSQAIHFRIRPIFRALLLVCEKTIGCSSGTSSYKVRIVRTGTEAHLSQPISFYGIKDIDGMVVCEDRAFETVVTTDLPTAIHFVNDLDARETAAFHEWREPGISDTRSWMHDNMDAEARARGYTGPPLSGNSSKFVKSDMEWPRTQCTTSPEEMAPLGVPLDL